MNKAVLLSTQPKWCEKIYHKIGENKDGSPIYEKRVEVRKTRPKLETPFKVYIYETKAIDKSRLVVYVDGNEPCQYYKGSGKVIGEFVCDEITECCSEFYPEEEHPVFEALYRLSEEFDNCWECIVSNDNDTSSKFLKETCLTLEDFREYLGNGENEFYAWHISNLVIYDKPKELSKFRKPCVWNYDCCTCEHWGEIVEDCCLDDSIKRPPQSWCYVEELSK